MALVLVFLMLVPLLVLAAGQETEVPPVCPILGCCEEDCCGVGTSYSSGTCVLDLISSGWNGTYSEGHENGCVLRVCCEDDCCGEGTIYDASLSCCVCDPAPGSIYSPPTVELWEASYDNIEAFALQFYNETGAPQALEWISDPSLVNSFKESFQTINPFDGGINHDLTLPTHIQISDGTKYEFNLIDVEAGEEGYALFEDAAIPLNTPQMLATIEQAYDVIEYSSSKEKEKETPGDNDCPFTEEKNVTKSEPDPDKDITEIELIVHQDDKGKSWLKKYAEDKAQADPNVDSSLANGKNSIINKMKCLREENKCIKTLTFAVHGSPGSFRIGPQKSKFNSPTRVGQKNKQTSPEDFGKCIKPYLCDDATVHLLSCSTSKNSGATSDGQKFIKELADAAMAPVRGYDKKVKWPGFKDPKTQGACHEADGDGTATEVAKPSPAGDLD